MNIVISLCFTVLSTTYIASTQECKSTEAGYEYAGTVSHTASGYTCQMWHLQTPYQHNFRDEHFPGLNMTQAWNYCRNPDRDKYGPWCYTTQPHIDFEECYIPLCNPKPVYSGFLAETFTGLRCQAWSVQHPQEHRVGVADWEFPDRDVQAASNYCRNPDNDAMGPWCFIDDSNHVRDHCLIPGFTIGEMTTTVLWDRAHILIRFIYPVIILLGTFLNMLSICVPNLKHTTTSFLFVMLAITDTLSLFTAVEEWLKNMTGLYLSASTDVSCKIYRYISYVITDNSGWILIAVITERVINMVRPHTAALICTKNNAVKLLCSFLICICVCYIPVPMLAQSFHTIISDKDGITLHVDVFCGYFGSVITWLKSFIHCIVPFTLMLIGNIIVIILLYKTIKKRRSFGNAGTTHLEYEKLISLSILTISACFTYLFLTMPYMLYLSIDIEPLYDTYNDYVFATLLFFVCAMLLEYVNNSINFLLYCMGSRRFRNEFLSMVKLSRYCSYKASNTLECASQPPVRLREQEIHNANDPNQHLPQSDVSPQPCVSGSSGQRCHTSVVQDIHLLKPPIDISQKKMNVMVYNKTSQTTSFIQDNQKDHIPCKKNITRALHSFDKC